MIAQLLDNYLLEKQEQKKLKVRSGKMNPSSFGQCFRRQYWNRKNETPTNQPDIEALRTFECGNVFHSLFERLLPSHQTEVEIDTEDIHGFADIVPENSVEVIDIKSQRSYVFTALNKLSEIERYKWVETEKPDYVIQLMTYVMVLGRTVGRLVFVNKDSLELREFTFRINDWRSKVESEIERNRAIWVQGELPPALPRLYKGKEGQYCQFLNKCIEEEVKNGRQSPCFNCSQRKEKVSKVKMQDLQESFHEKPF